MKTGKVLVIDDEKQFLDVVKRLLEKDGWVVEAFENPIIALDRLESEEFDMVLTDVKMPELDGIEVCKRVKKSCPETEVVMMTGIGTVEVAVDSMKAGAYDFLLKPFEHPEVVSNALTRAAEKKRLSSRNRFLEQQLEITSRFENIIGSSAKMKKVYRLIESVAPTTTTVLIIGESGTGKELVARAVHERSERKSLPFLAINCSAFTETLLESELFGHLRGAFTGASGSRKGLFEEASGGTLFLDEIGDMALSTQAKLLRVVQEGEFKPVGSNDIRRTDVRIIAATNMDLETAIKESQFREDLYYRINVVTISVPPLRERAEDIPLLVHHFIRKYAKKNKKPVHGIEAQALANLQTARWAGNVRELENVIERAVVLTKGEEISQADLPDSIVAQKDPSRIDSLKFDLPFAEAKKHAVTSFERNYLEDVLTRAGGVIAEAARLANMDRSNFRRLMLKYELDVDQYRE